MPGGYVVSSVRHGRPVDGTELRTLSNTTIEAKRLYLDEQVASYPDRLVVLRSGLQTKRAAQSSERQRPLTTW